MAYDDKSIADIIAQCESFVDHLDDEAHKWRQVEDGTYDFAALIPDELYKGENGSQKPLIMRRQGLENDRKIIESLVGWPARISVDLPKAGPEAGRKEDEWEAAFAYSSHRCDPRGKLKETLHHYQVMWPYTGIWQYVVPYNPPKAKAGETTAETDYRIAAYDKKYWRWAWEVPTPNTISFSPLRGDASVACLNEEMPVLDFMDLYAEQGEEDLSPLELYAAQFDWLRASDGTSPDRDNSTQWFQGKKVKRQLVCDGQNIYHCIEHAGGDKGKQHKISKTVPNTFGRCSYVLVNGTYRPGNSDRQYTSLITEYAHAYHNVTLTHSLYKTMLANDKWITALPESVANSIAMQALQDPDVKHLDQYQVSILPNSSNPVMGTPTHATNLPEKWWDELQMAEQQLKEVRAPILALRPDEVTQRNAPATSVLAAREEGTRPFRGPTTSWNTMYVDLFTMQVHDIVYGLNPHVANVGTSKENNVDIYGKKNAEAMRFLAGDYSGKSAYQPAAKIAKGSEHFLTPEMAKEFLDDGEVRVLPIEDTDSSRAASAQLKQALLNNPGIPLATPEEVWEAEGETDVTGKAKRINSYTMCQYLFPKQENLIWIHWLEKVAAREGRSVPEMAALVGAAPQMGVNGDNMPQGDQMNVQTMAAPPGPSAPPPSGGV